MDAYTGIYYLQGGEEKEVSVLFQKDKLSIGLLNDDRNPLVVYWYYDQIAKENFWKTGKAIVHYPGYPAQVLEVASKDFANELELKVNPSKILLINKIFAPGLMPVYKVLFGLGSIIALVYFFLIPLLAVRMANRVPVSYEEKLGNNLFDAMKGGFKIDTQRTADINEFFKEIKITTPYNIKITVVNEDVPNAFAMPGGNIVVYSKILADMNGYEDLAALLSHEFTHVQNKHTTKSLFRKLGGSIFLSVILGDAGAIASVLVSNADNLKSLSYGRSLEKEADLYGVKILSERKIDCNGFVRLFQLLKKETDGLTVSEWISSHPDLDKRIDYIKKDENFNKNGVQANQNLKSIFLKLKTSD
jgi:beta-barrel assembly-enhancing protease